MWDAYAPARAREYGRGARPAPPVGFTTPLPSPSPAVYMVRKLCVGRGSSWVCCATKQGPPSVEGEGVVSACTKPADSDRKLVA